MTDEREQQEENADARRRLRIAFADELSGPRPGVESRVLAGLDLQYGHHRRPWLAIAAGGLALLVVASLLGIRFLGLGFGRGPVVRDLIPGASSSSSASPRPSPSITNSATPPPSASPTAVGGANLPCRLPLDLSGTAAFATIPASGPVNGLAPQANVSIDPSGHPKLPDGEDPTFVSYHWGLQKWLPAKREWISPDGSRYAYSDRKGALHVVDAASGQDRILNSDQFWAVIDFQAEGIYVAGISGPSTTPGGLWLIDPANASVRQIQGSGPWQAVGYGQAWELIVTQPSVPVPSPQLPLVQDGLFGNTLVRLDLATGKTMTIYTSAGTEFRLVGIDADGDPVLLDLSSFASPLVIVSAPGRTNSTGSGAWTNALVDGNRTWFADTWGISIWLKDSSGTRQMAGLGASIHGMIRIAGGCH